MRRQRDWGSRSITGNLSACDKNTGNFLAACEKNTSNLFGEAQSNQISLSQAGADKDITGTYRAHIKTELYLESDEFSNYKHNS